jgi:hypothetical protein
VTPRRFVLLALAVAALAAVLAVGLRGRAEWTPVEGPAEPGTLPGR